MEKDDVVLFDGLVKRILSNVCGDCTSERDKTDHLNINDFLEVSFYFSRVSASSASLLAWVVISFTLA